MLRRSYRFIGFLICCFSPLMISPAWSVEQPKKAKAPNIEPRAAQVLKHMTDYLKGLQQFSVQAEITEDVLLDSGLTIQDGRSVTASVRRPNRLRADAVGDLGDRQLFYDGKTMTLMDLSKMCTAPSTSPRRLTLPCTMPSRPTISGRPWRT